MDSSFLSLPRFGGGTSKKMLQRVFIFAQQQVLVPRRMIENSWRSRRAPLLAGAPQMTGQQQVQHLQIRVPHRHVKK